MKWIYYLLLGAVCLNACNEEEEIIPTEGSEVFYELPQGDHDYDAKIVDYYEKYGIYILYEFAPKDLYWNNMGWSEFEQKHSNDGSNYVPSYYGDLLGAPADPAYAGKLLEMCEQCCFGLYPEEYLKHLPLRFLLCSELSKVVTVGIDWVDGIAVSKRDTLPRNTYASFNRFAVNWGSEAIDTMSYSSKLYFSKDINGEFISILKDNEVFEYDDKFMITGHSYKYEVLTGEKLFKRGFLTNTTLVNGNITQSRINDFFAFLKLATVPLDVLNAEPVSVDYQDVEPSVVGLFKRVYADADDGRVDGKTGIDFIKRKYEFVIELLKTKYGIDTDKLQYPEK